MIVAFYLILMFTNLSENHIHIDFTSLRPKVFLRNWQSKCNYFHFLEAGMRFRGYGVYFLTAHTQDQSPRSLQLIPCIVAAGLSAYHGLPSLHLFNYFKL